MANRNFRKNLFLALGSLGALSGTIYLTTSAMEESCIIDYINDI